MIQQVTTRPRLRTVSTGEGHRFGPRPPKARYVYPPPDEPMSARHTSGWLRSWMLTVDGKLTRLWLVMARATRSESARLTNRIRSTEQIESISPVDGDARALPGLTGQSSER